MTLVMHAFNSPSLLSELRQRITRSIKPGPSLKFSITTLEKDPLLNSMYAEALRFGVQIHVPRVSPHDELMIGTKTIPKNKLIFINTWLAHTDETTWNTKAGAFPLTEFWPQRFLVDPSDPCTGPVKDFRANLKTEPGSDGSDGGGFSFLD